MPITENRAVASTGLWKRPTFFLEILGYAADRGHSTKQEMTTFGLPGLKFTLFLMGSPGMFWGLEAPLY